MQLLRSRMISHLSRRTTTSVPRQLSPQHARNVSVSVAMTEAAPIEGPPRSFTSFSVYKTKAAVQFKLLPPTFRQIVTGRESGYPQVGYALEREGVMLLSFANAVESKEKTGYGSNVYNWQDKVTFALKPLELADIADFDTLPKGKAIDLFHDPNKGKADALTKVSKSLKFQEGQNSGYQMMVTQNISGQRKIVSVALTRAEFVVLKSIAQYAIPRLYGFDYQFEGQGEPYNVVQTEAEPYTGEAEQN